MFVKLTCYAPNAPEIGYLLAKNPASVFQRAFSGGEVWAFYPEVADDHVSIVLITEIDAVALVRGPAALAGPDQYVNDRPYVASSLTAVALNMTFRTAMNASSTMLPARVHERLRWSVELPTMACDGGADLISKLFVPLGYTASATRLPLDERFPEWGEADLYSVRLEGEQTTADVFNHLYLLLPVLDNAKHYAVSDDEMEKLVARGGAWLAAHPARDLIARRYLRYRRPLVAQVASALGKLVADEPELEVPSEDDAGDAGGGPEGPANEPMGEIGGSGSEGPANGTGGMNASEESGADVDETAAAGITPAIELWGAVAPPTQGATPPPMKAASASLQSAQADFVAARPPGAVSTADASTASSSTLTDKSPGLHEQRLAAVMEAVRAAGARTLVDLGCGEGRLLALALKEKGLSRILGMDVSTRALGLARRKLHYDHLPPAQRARLELIHGSLLYRDARLAGFDAAALVEVIEHLDAPRLGAMERVIFEHARPRRVIVTTPNREYNAHWASLHAGEFRHEDHRFEWTRADCRAWAERVAATYGYTARWQELGPMDGDLGAPSQMVVFDLPGASDR